ncbi:hypothetical protein GCM10027521_43060 [Amycolatopsis cihanbeyliensis]
MFQSLLRPQAAREHPRQVGGVVAARSDLEGGAQGGQRAEQLVRGVGEEPALPAHTRGRALQQVVQGGDKGLDLGARRGRLESRRRVTACGLGRLPAQQVHGAQGPAERQPDQHPDTRREQRNGRRGDPGDGAGRLPDIGKRGGDQHPHRAVVLSVDQPPGTESGEVGAAGDPAVTRWRGAGVGVDVDLVQVGRLPDRVPGGRQHGPVRAADPEQPLGGARVHQGAQGVRVGSAARDGLRLRGEVGRQPLAQRVFGGGSERPRTQRQPKDRDQSGGHADPHPQGAHHRSASIR